MWLLIDIPEDPLLHHSATYCIQSVKSRWFCSVRCSIDYFLFASTADKELDTS